MQKQVSIVLVDDHTIVRNGLKSLIEVLGNNKVTGEYDNGKQFIESLASLPNPDLVIMDLNMPEMNGSQTMAWVHTNRPALKVLVLTLDTDDKTIIKLYRLGIRGYLPKNCTAEELKQAIDGTVHTGYYHSDLLQQALMADAEHADRIKKVLELVSERERVFLQLICDKDEYTYEQISSLMNVHRRTVDGYREALSEKFNIRSKTGLVLFAIKHGIVTL